MASPTLIRLKTVTVLRVRSSFRFLFKYRRLIIFAFMVCFSFNLGREWEIMARLTLTNLECSSSRNLPNLNNVNRNPSSLCPAGGNSGDTDTDTTATMTSNGSDSDPRMVQFVPECNCNRKWFYTPPGKYFSRLNSTCSDEATFYQVGQQVVSISMTFPRNKTNSTLTKPICPPDIKPCTLRKLFMEGLRQNLENMKVYYPLSTLRLYTDENLQKDPEYCKIYCSNPSLMWCDIRKSSLGDKSESFLMTWRFLPLGDISVDYFLSRDLDSVIIYREVAAVHEWLHSHYAFHVMRDIQFHKSHIMGGLWGASNSKLGLEVAAYLRDEILSRAKIPGKQNKGDDQFILKEVIWNWKKSEVLIFDAYFCTSWWRWGFTDPAQVRPFPVRRKNPLTDIVGNKALGRRLWKHKLDKCPESCRPCYGKDWEYC